MRDPSVRCIMSTIGGFNSNSLLPYLDYQALQADPKILVGYSDVTAILLACMAQTGLRPFYGPALVASFGEFPPLVDETYASFHDLACAAPAMPYVYRAPNQWTDEWIDWNAQDRAKRLRPNEWTFHGSGIVSGRLMGGNLNTMGAIWGSPYLPSIEPGDILLLEDCGLDAAAVERSFAFLKINGVFDRISAILLGKHERYNDLRSGRQPIDLLLEVLASHDLPIVDGFDCCHTHPMLTVPLGATIAIDSAAQQIRIQSPWTT